MKERCILATNGSKMRLFARKPSRALEAEFVKQAKGVLCIFGCALQLKTTNPAADKGDDALDLTVKDNRDSIRDELVRIIREHGLEGCNEAEIGGARLIPLVVDKSKSAITHAAVDSALAINSLNLVTRAYYEDYPKHQPLYDMVNNLAKTCCTGAAQTIGPNLPGEVMRTWPYFSRIFEETKRSDTWLWPDV